MPTPRMTRQQMQEAVDALRAAGGSQVKAAEALGLSRSALQHRLALAERELARPATEAEFTVDAIPDDDIDVADLVEHRIRQFERKRQHEAATRLIGVNVRAKGPIGLLVFGDPHVDDDGTDLALLRRHMEITHEDGVYGLNIGDSQNAWVGRLARLWAEQGTSAKQAAKLVEWLFRGTRWMAIIAGNHDCWLGGGDPLAWLSLQAGVLHQNHGARLELRFPNGRKVIVNARHDFAGSSQWNPAHGQMKAARFGGGDHVRISGHKHISGYGVVKDVATGRTCHAVQVASYKVFDRYAAERGFLDQAVSPAAFLLIDPALPDTHPDLVKVYWDPEEGAAALALKRAHRRAA